MNCVDDLGVVDPLEVDRGDAEVAVAELALDDHERHTFASHFDGVGVPQLMWAKAQRTRPSIRRQQPLRGRSSSETEQVRRSADYRRSSKAELWLRRGGVPSPLR
jgi:hypothetical protein